MPDPSGDAVLELRARVAVCQSYVQALIETLQAQDQANEDVIDYGYRISQHLEELDQMLRGDKPADGSGLDSIAVSEAPARPSQHSSTDRVTGSNEPDRRVTVQPLRL